VIFCCWLLLTIYYDITILEDLSKLPIEDWLESFSYQSNIDFIAWKRVVRSLQIEYSQAFRRILICNLVCSASSERCLHEILWWRGYIWLHCISHILTHSAHLFFKYTPLKRKHWISSPKWRGFRSFENVIENLHFLQIHLIVAPNSGYTAPIAVFGLTTPIYHHQNSCLVTKPLSCFQRIDNS